MDYPPLLNETTITNIGVDPLTVESINFTLNEGNTYSIDAIYQEARLGALLPITPPFTLASGKAAYVRIKFQPNDIWPYLGSLRIASNDPHNATVTVSLLGMGDPPSCNQTCTSTVEARGVASNDLGRWILPIYPGGNITQRH